MLSLDESYYGFPYFVFRVLLTCIGNATWKYIPAIQNIPAIKITIVDRKYFRSLSFETRSRDCFVYLFGFFSKIENFPLIWRRHHYRWRAANFDLCSALMVIEQRDIFSVPQLLWHRASVYNGHLRGPECRAFGSGAVTTCFNDLSVTAEIQTPKLPIAGRTLIPTAPPPWRVDCIFCVRIISCNR